MLKATIVSFFLVVFIQFCACGNSFAGHFTRSGSVIGEISTYHIASDDSLYEIARRHDVGIEAIADANPGVDLFIPSPGTKIIIPTQWILPDAPIRRGIVINVAEMRLYYFHGTDTHEVTSFPVGIGDQGKDTPVGTFTIIEKIRNPAWYVPQSIRLEKPELPAVVPPGPDNPMGNYALRLSNQTVLIHGTNRPWGIGTRNSHGCLRLYPEDIAALFDMVQLHTQVTIVNEPVKVALSADHVYMEVHDYEDGRDLYADALKVLAVKKLAEKVDPDKVKQACKQPSGLLVDVTGAPVVPLQETPTGK